MIGEFLQVTVFYLVFSIFGLIGLPVVARFLSPRSMLTYIISKPIGLAMFAYPVWMLSSLKILPFSNQAILYILFFVAVIAGVSLFLWKYRVTSIKKLIEIIKANRMVFVKILLVEIVSLLILFAYLYIRGFNAKIEGTERFMDMMLYMSAGKTDFFPFFDGWQANMGVNYYYYGFYIFALLTRMAGEEYAFGYNFSFGLIFLFTILLSFSIVYKLTRSVFFSVFGAGLVGLSGNLHYMICVFNNIGNDPSKSCFYPVASRIQYPGTDTTFTINEFPLYSFALGDMHPHVMSLPFFLTNIFLLIVLFRSPKTNPYLMAVLAFMLASVAMINTWDFITLGIVYSFVFVYRSIRRFKKENKKNLPWLPTLFTHIIRGGNGKTKKQFAQVKQLFLQFSTIFFLPNLLWSMLFALAPFLLFFPFFLLHFNSPVEGIIFAPNFVNEMRGKPVIELIAREDIPLDEDGNEQNSIKSNEVAYFNPEENELIKEDAGIYDKMKDTLVVGPVNEYYYPSTFNFLAGIWAIFIVASSISLAVIYLLSKCKIGTTGRAVTFILFLLATGIGLIIFTETFFFADMFHFTSPQYFRANTVFKFGYHAWILLGLATGALLGLAWKQVGKITHPWAGIMADIGIVVLVGIIGTISFPYVFYSFKHAYDPHLPWNMDKEFATFTLDGTDYMEKREPDDYAVVQWLNENQKERIVVLEAPGGAYTYYGRISVNTGMGNPLNWETHHWQWRFKYPKSKEDPQKTVDWKDKKNGVPYTSHWSNHTRAIKEDIKTMYESDNYELTNQLLAKYNIKYVYIGNLERKDFEVNEAKFDEIGTEVVSSGESKLFAIY